MLLTASLCTIAVAQTPTEGGATASSVTVPFFVNDSHGEAVGGISPSEIVVFDNKKPQSILGIRTAAQLPLRLGILIDTSTSEAHSGVYRAAVESIHDLLKDMLRPPDDRAFVLTFDTVPNATSLMTPDQAANFKIDLALGGGTALYDSVYLACDERMKVDAISPARRVLVVLSDGVDNSSRVNHDQAIAAAQAAGTVIFAISTIDSPSGDRENWMLQQFADKTGGSAFLHLGRKDIPKVFSKIKGEIENMYAVTYVPAEPVARGQYRSLEVKGRSAKELRIRSAKGYYAR